MSGTRWWIPPSVLRRLEHLPGDRAVVVLLRHSIRAELPPDDVGHELPITDVGRQLALDLGGHLQGRLQTLHTSPLLRCVQTAKALAAGSKTDIAIIRDPLLGDPGVFVLDGRLAWANWEEFGHEGVMRHLVTKTVALPGMARPDEAAWFLVRSMFAAAAGRPGVHVFVTHDSLVIPTAARLLGKEIGTDDWPWYLEGVFFWISKGGVHAAYRDYHEAHPDVLCDLGCRE